MLRTLLLCAMLALSAAFVPPSALPVQRAQASQQHTVSMIALTKPQRTNQRRREYNKMYKSEMKTAIKRVSSMPACWLRPSLPPPAGVREPLSNGASSSIDLHTTGSPTPAPVSGLVGDRGCRGG